MINEYLNADEDVCSWFGGPWNSIEALENWPQALDPQHTWDRSQLVHILNNAAKEHNASPATRDNIKLLRDNDCYTIITGQQPAVGGGPLYTLIKAAHAIASAQQLRASGCKVVPIFWCASEDHDEGEANHADFIDHDGQVHRFQSTFEYAGASTHFQKAGIWWQGLINTCRDICGPGLGANFINSLKPHDNESMGQWQCRLLAQLFADEGLICLEARHLRPLWHPKLSDIIAHWPQLALAHQRKHVLDRGYSDSFRGLLNQPPLFLDRRQGRESIMDNDARTMRSWAHNLHLDDHSLSCGAALRPIIQQICLPGMAYVGGPGELHYHAFLGPIYKELKAPMPRFIPRCSFTLIPAWLQHKLKQWNIQAADIQLSSTAPTIDSSDLAAQEFIDALHSLITQEESRLTQYPKNVRQRMLTGIQRLHQEKNKLHKSMQRYQRQQKELVPFANLQNFMYPRGKPQERVMSISQTIWLYGPGIAQVLIEHCKKSKAGYHADITL